MAKNDVVLLDSLVTKFKDSLNGAWDAGESFEVFAFDQLLKDYDLSFEELESCWTDGAEDGGVDGFFIFVDGHLVTETSFLAAARSSPEIAVHVFSVRHAESFQQEPINSLYNSLSELFDLGRDSGDLQYPFSDEIIQQRELFKQTFLTLADRRPALKVTVHYCSRGDTRTLATNLTTRAKQIEELLLGLFSDIKPEFLFSGASELLERARKQKTYALRLPFIETYISREGKNYVLLCRVKDYFDFVRDDEGKLRRYLFDANVRDYLGAVQINRDIADTLARPTSTGAEDFWWLNNGVTILGTFAGVVGKALSIENVQIINGLQTTETIFHHFRERQKEDDDSRAILVKVIVAADEETRARIIKATNYQNSVDLASLRGLDKIQRDIEHYLLDRGWFYDRRKNYYKNQGKPADRIVSVPYLAAAVRAVALSDPASSQRQRSKSLRDEAVYSQVFDPKWDLQVFLVSLEVTRCVERVLETRRKLFYSPPIALVHYISYVHVATKLGYYKYKPNELSKLEDYKPTTEDVLKIKDDLAKVSIGFKGEGHKYYGVRLNPHLIDSFVKAHLPPRPVEVPTQS